MIKILIFTTISTIATFLVLYLASSANSIVEMLIISVVFSLLLVLSSIRKFL